jgi:hypothetical protein
MNLTKFTPYPGSPVYRELYGTAIRDDHWEKMNGMNFVWAPDGISVQALDRHYQDVINWCSVLLDRNQQPSVGRLTAGTCGWHSCRAVYLRITGQGRISCSQRGSALYSKVSACDRSPDAS